MIESACAPAGGERRKGTRKKGPAEAESTRKKLIYRWGTTGETEKMSEHCKEGVGTRGTSCFALFFRLFFLPRRNSLVDCSRGKNCSPRIARDSPCVSPCMAGPLFYFNTAKQTKSFWRLARRRCLPGQREVCARGRVTDERTCRCHIDFSDISAGKLFLLKYSVHRFLCWLSVLIRGENNP